MNFLYKYREEKKVLYPKNVGIKSDIMIPMLANFNWKPYFVIIGIISVICFIISWQIGVGVVIGTLFYFVNDKLNLKKFPKLDEQYKAVGSMLLIMALQGLLTIIAAVACWFIGKLPCFFACFGALVLPTVYFFITNIKK